MRINIKFAAALFCLHKVVCFSLAENEEKLLVLIDKNTVHRFFEGGLTSRSPLGCT